MQLGQAFQGKKCARCRHALQSDAVCEDDLWYHRTCLEEGKRALQRARNLPPASAVYLWTPASRKSNEAKKGVFARSSETVH